jgi:hypothetical protein
MMYSMLQAATFLAKGEVVGLFAQTVSRQSGSDRCMSREEDLAGEPTSVDGSERTRIRGSKPQLRPSMRRGDAQIYQFDWLSRRT